MPVGLMGPIGAGKTTVATMLEQAMFERRPFAGPLKAMLRALGLSLEHTDGALKDRPCELLCGQTPRRAMQTLGTEWGRDLVGPALWANAWRCAVEARPGRVVADDLRFPNEAEMIRTLGGQVWLIERPGIAVGDHVSEQLWRQIVPDRVIANDGDLARLSAVVARAAADLFVRSAA